MSTSKPIGLSRRRVLRLASSTLAALAAAPMRAALAAYPDRFITLIVPFAPGGASDLLGRAISVPLGQSLGQSVVVENRGGAGGNIGIAAAARARPDGYTLLCTSSAFVVNPSLYKRVQYDPFTDFMPVVDLGSSPNVIVAHPSAKLTSLAELVAGAKANPQLFNYSSPGAGTTPQLSAELLKLRAGIQLAHVPFAGAGPALQSVVAGTTQLSALNLSVVIQQIKAGTVTALVQTGETRWPDLPDVPTMAEAGYPNSVSETFQAIFAPAGTPPDIVDGLAKALVEIVGQAAFKDKMTQAGFGVTGTGPDALRARVTREVPMWKEVIDKAGIKID